MTFTPSTTLNAATVYLAGSVTGWFAVYVGLPLPWMIGSIITAATLYLTGFAQKRLPVLTRIPGQVIVATQVGIAFTPAALAALIDHFALLVGMAALTAIWASVCALLLQQISGQRYTTAFLATIPTSPVEAALMAERLGQPTSMVALAQTFRIAAVVIIVPISVYIIDGWPDTRIRPSGSEPFQPTLTLLLLICGAAGGFAFRRLNIANPWFIGPLAAAALIASTGLRVPSHPAVLLAGAQIVMGSFLGSTFTPETLSGARRTTFAVFYSALTFLLLCVVSAGLMARASGIDWEILLLGGAPGGVTEMALTARFMGLDLAMVTAFHLTRVFLVVPFVPYLAAWLHARETRQV